MFDRKKFFRKEQNIIFLLALLFLVAVVADNVIKPPELKLSPGLGGGFSGDFIIFFFVGMVVLLSVVLMYIEKKRFK